MSSSARTERDRAHDRRGLPAHSAGEPSRGDRVGSVVVPVPVVLGVPVAVVQVVHMVTVLDPLVSAALAVPVVVALVGAMRVGLALVPVPGVLAVQMAVVRVVDVV